MVADRVTKQFAEKPTRGQLNRGQNV